jgi:hypothetical protein
MAVWAAHPTSLSTIVPTHVSVDAIAIAKELDGSLMVWHCMLPPYFREVRREQQLHVLTIAVGAVRIVPAHARSLWCQLCAAPMRNVDTT